MLQQVHQFFEIKQHLGKLFSADARLISLPQLNIQILGLFTSIFHVFRASPALARSAPRVRYVAFASWYQPLTHSVQIRRILKAKKKLKLFAPKFIYLVFDFTSATTQICKVTAWCAYIIDGYIRQTNRPMGDKQVNTMVNKDLSWRSQYALIYPWLRCYYDGPGRGVQLVAECVFFELRYVLEMSLGCENFRSLFLQLLKKKSAEGFKGTRGQRINAISSSGHNKRVSPGPHCVKGVWKVSTADSL